MGYLPEDEPRRRLGSLSVFQQTEELRQLAALAAIATGPTAAGTPAEGAVSTAAAAATPAAGTGEAPPTAAPPADERVDQLAAWLLTQADLSDL